MSMSSNAISEQISNKPSTSMQRWCRSLLLSRLAGLKDAGITLSEGEQDHVLGDNKAALQAYIEIHDPSFYTALVFAGGVGAGESYMQGLWDSPDLTTLMRVLARNRSVLPKIEGGMAKALGWMQSALYRMQRNSMKGSRKNIAAHYDLDHRFFRLFLDHYGQYSSAYFPTANGTLEDGQLAKMRRIGDTLGLSPRTKVVEIGTGWGGLAVYLAKHYGCHVTTTTISQSQYEQACRLVQQEGLGERVKVVKQDYRLLQGRYDRLVSVEMIEAVGDQYLTGYFDKISSLLKDDGLALIQAITIEDYRYQQALRRMDFIKKFIFPGSFIPSVSRICTAMSETDLGLVNLHEMGTSYARTLAHWRQRFHDQKDAVQALGFDERFMRMWHYYLCYCEGGFAERAIGNVQLLFAKPEAGRAGIEVVL